MQRFTSAGVLLDLWGEPGEGPGQFSGIRGLDVTPSGEIYISDSDPWDWEPSRVQRYTAEGEFIDEFWQHGEEPDDFSTNGGLELGPDSLLYVTDINRGVLVFTRTGEFHSHWLYEPPLRSPRDIAFGWDPDLGRHVAYVHADGPIKYEILGDVIEDRSGGYDYASIATDRDGNVYVERRRAFYHIEKYSPAFGLLALFGAEGTEPGQLTQGIAGIAVDDSGYVYVADCTLERVQKFRRKPATGVATTTWGAIKARTREGGNP